MIRLTGIDKSFSEGGRSRPVLIQASLEVSRGEFICISGRSGSGKSTLLNILSGIELPDGGEVVIDGRSLVGRSDYQRTMFRRRHLGFVFQFFNLIPTLTVAENLRLPLQLNAIDDPRRVAHWLARVDLEDRGGAYPDTLSGGEQQRIAIIRALIHEPVLVLADEPTGNLDADTGQQVLGILNSLCRDQGATLVVVSHSTEVAAIADRILNLDHGQLTGSSQPATSTPKRMY